MEKRRLYQLDFFRFFSIAVIVLSHFEFLKSSIIGNFYLKYLHNASFGVDFFFLVSGFGLFYVSKDEKPITFITCLKYSIKRMKKIYGIYVFSMLLSFPWILIFAKMSFKNLMAKFFINLTLMQSIFGSTRISHGVNAVCWFMSTLAICYFFAPILIHFIKVNFKLIKTDVLGILTAIMFILLLSYIFFKIENRVPFFDDLSYGTPYIRIWYVLIGMLICDLYEKTEAIFKKNTSILEITILFWIIIYFFMRNSISLNYIFKRFLDLISVISVFLYIYENGIVSKFLSNDNLLSKAARKYGMYIYFIHYPVRESVGHCLVGYDLSLAGYLIEILIIIVITLFLSMFSYSFFYRKS